jgi:hypothetical protein
MPNANTIRRQIGGGLVRIVGSVDTLAPIVNPGTLETAFQFYSQSGSEPATTSPDGGYIGGGVIPLSVGPTNLYQGFTQDGTGLILGRGAYQGTGQVLHLAVTGFYSGMTANSTTIKLGVWEVPAAIIQAGGLSPASQTGFNRVCQSSGVQVPSASGQFTFDVYLQFDAEGTLNGYFQGQIGETTPLTPAACANIIDLAGEADLNFVLTAQLGVSAPSTAVLTVDEFRIDLESPGASTIQAQSENGTVATVINPSTTPTAFTFSVPPMFDGASSTNFSSGVVPLSAGVTGLYAGTGAVLVVGAAGSFAGMNGGATTLTLDLYEVPAAVIAAGLSATSFTGWNKVGTSGAIQVPNPGGPTADGSFQFVAKLQLDAEGNLQGTFTTSIAGGTPTAPAAINGITGLVGEADLNFVMVATLGVSALPTSVLTQNKFTLAAQ